MRRRTGTIFPIVKKSVASCLSDNSDWFVVAAVIAAAAALGFYSLLRTGEYFFVVFVLKWI